MLSSISQLLTSIMASSTVRANFIDDAFDDISFIQAFANTTSTLVGTDRAISTAMQHFLEKRGLDWFFEHFAMFVPPGLPEVLLSDEPPPWDFFLSLPAPHDLTLKDL